MEVRKETVYQNKYKLKVLTIYSILSRAKEVDTVIMVLKLWDWIHTRYVSFKGTSADNRLDALYTNNIINNKAKFEVLEDLLVN